MRADLCRGTLRGLKQQILASAQACWLTGRLCACQACAISRQLESQQATTGCANDQALAALSARCSHHADKLFPSRCRVAQDGSLPAVQTTPSLPEQFGLHCAVVRRLTRGFPWKVYSLLVRPSPCRWRHPKGCRLWHLAVAWCPLLALELDYSGAPVQVVAHRAYLRTNTGNHRVVTARTAARYFGPAPPGVRSPRCARHQHVSTEHGD